VKRQLYSIMCEGSVKRQLYSIMCEGSVKRQLYSIILFQTSNGIGRVGSS